MRIKEFFSEWKLLITSISSLTFFIITVYTAYLDIYKEINNKTNQIELTQMSILKNQIKYLERYPCKVSRDEWAEYNMLFTQYYKLLKKHNPLLTEMDIKPIERLDKDSCRCFRGQGECNE